MFANWYSKFRSFKLKLKNYLHQTGSRAKFQDSLQAREQNKSIRSSRLELLAENSSPKRFFRPWSSGWISLEERLTETTKFNCFWAMVGYNPIWQSCLLWFATGELSTADCSLGNVYPNNATSQEVLGSTGRERVCVCSNELPWKLSLKSQNLKIINFMLQRLWFTRELARDKLAREAGESLNG